MTKSKNHWLVFADDEKDSLAGAGRICDCLHFDLHSVPESEPDIILAVDDNEVNVAVELL